MGTTLKDLKQAQIDLQSSQGEIYQRLRELEVIYETVPLGLAFLDEHLRYVRLNESFAAANHMPIEEHIGRRSIEINPALAQLIVPMMSQVLATNLPMRDVEAGEDSKSWLVDVHPVSKERPFGVLVALHELSEYKKNEEALTNCGLIVQHSKDAIISMKMDGSITSWNPAAEKMLGYTAKEVIGKPIALLGEGQPQHELQGTLFLQQHAGKEGDYETVHRRQDGTAIDIAVTVSPIIDRHGRMTGACQIIRDITQQKRDRAALLLRNEELSQFAYAAAHDLQEPLRNITLSGQFLSSLQQAELSNEAIEQLNTIVDSARRMQTLIRDLLDYTKVIDLNKEHVEGVDCNLACRRAMENLAASVRGAEAHIVITSLPTVCGEAVQIARLFQNLIGNALKYRAPERQLEIRVAAEQTNGSWVFSVSDNGIGIAPEHHERIFGLFKRLHGREVPGTGIGLALCKRIVEHSGGRLWVESEPDVGSTFYFTLPAAKVRSAESS